MQSWNLSLAILNLCLISAIMTLGVNIQWGYAGIVNFGIMGFAALGGLAGVLVSMPPVRGGLAGWRAWSSWWRGGGGADGCSGGVCLGPCKGQYTLALLDYDSGDHGGLSCDAHGC